MALTYLDRVVYEIIETERTYVSDLRMIVEDYLAHIIDQADLSIRPEQVGFLFGNIEDIYEFNSELLQDLDLCQRDAVALARCFVMKSDSFDIYSQYCTNYPNSVAALTDCMQDKSLAVFFCDRQAALKRPLPLGSYLLKPVQRILKYHLLLQEIAKHFDPEEEGYEVVEEAIITMTGVAWYINDMKRKHEHAVRLQEVQSLLLNWKGPDLTTYGELVLEGTFKVLRAKTERTVYLLERVLLITKRRGEHFVYKSHISCATLMLIESTKDSLSFSVTHYKQPKQPLTLQAKSVDEKMMWAQHIKRIILENHHAIIPQKAKDTILNSRYPRRYRPDRLKKASSCSSDEFPHLPSGDQHTNTQVGVVSKETDRSDVSFNDSNEESGLGEDEEPGGPEAASQQMSTEPLESRPLSEREELKPAQLLLRAKGSPSTTPESQSKPGSSGESSEDEDGEKEADRNGSILPPSVLDKAGAIAQHFSSIKRGAPPVDDVGSPGASPRLLVTGRLSFNGRLAGRSSPLNSVSSDLSDTDRMLLSPRGDEERGNLGRRDSILSSRDQLLIGKIKTYYENAENQDAGFSLRRRESLTYIPAGVVKTSIHRLNSIPRRADPLPPSVETWRSQSLKGHMVYTESVGPMVTQKNANSTDSGVVANEFSRSGPDGQQNAEDEEFRPSSEMLQVWQVMEQQLDGTSGHARFKAEGAKLDPDALSQEASLTSPLNKANSMSSAGSPTVLGAQLPRGENLPDDKVDSKVRNLARRYSQRIKTVKPPDRQRSCGNLMGKTLTCVLEEEPRSGPNPNLEPVLAQSPEPNPARIRSHSPAGALQATEGFNWPDVRELRSKYSDWSGSATVGRSSSIPEQMFAVRSRSGSSTDGAPPRRSYPTWTTGRLRHRNAIHRGRALDPWMTGDLAHETREQRAANGVSDPVTAPTPQEKLTGKPQHSPEPEAGETIDDDDAYVEIRSPTSREKISILAVMDRCRAYQESDEYKQRSQPAKSQDSFKSTGEHFQTAGDHLKTPPSGQQNLVKNLREKFQKLNP
ncbi:pleckstrin homology domain-containing family G member 3 isoform X2 [Syngnathus scovelli]|nr:pleckstrin homology domain-containing family G member 3 isoform X2 [Syngnathus scovelli]